MLKHNASISVTAIIDEQKGHWSYVKTTNSYRAIIVRQNSKEDPVSGYRIVHREWDSKYDDDPNYWEGGEVSYQQTYTVTSETELIHLLHQLHIDLSEFHQ